LQALAVIDIGKTRSKILVADPRGNLLEEVSTETSSSGTCLDAEGIWIWMLQALRQLTLKHAISAVFPVAHGAAAALIDDRGLVRPILDYETDLSEIDAAYNRLRSDFQASHSPNLPHGLNLGRQLYWIQQKHPKDWSAARHILLYPQYWAWRLCGVAATEVTSLGSHTDLWQPAQRSYSGLAENIGVCEKMPPMHNAWDVLAKIAPDVAAATGLPPDCAVYCGVHDSNASFARFVGSRGKFSVVSTGTWVICMANGVTPELDPERDTLSNVDIFGNAIPCARFMGGREFAEIRGKNSSTPSLEIAGDLVKHQRLVLPAFCKQGGPFSGHMGSLPEGSTGRERASLASLYCAMVTDYCLELIQASGPLYVEGRFITDPVFLAALASLRAPVLTSSEKSGTLAGAVSIVNIGTGQSRVPNDSIEVNTTITGMPAYQQQWRAAVAGGFTDA